MRLAGRTAIVTGAASGIGAATAVRMAQEGASVVVADLNIGGATEVAARICAAGGVASACCVDVSVEQQVSAMVCHAIAQFGRLDILHNNAALTGHALHEDKGVEFLDLEVWDRTMAVNARGVAFACKFAIPVLRAAGGGSIINTASAAGGLGDYERTAYGASKAAVMAITRYVATQHGKDGIRCNTVVPGLVMTPSAEDYLSADDKEMLRAAMLTPWFGSPEDVAELVVFLASDQSRYITGQAIWIDGGASARSQNAAVGSVWQRA